jgi:hypothetical protein
MAENETVGDFLQTLVVQVDQFAALLADKPEDDAERALEFLRQELSRSLRTTFGKPGAEQLAATYADAVERRSQEIEPVRSHLLN